MNSAIRMSDNSQDNGQHPVIDDETSVQPEDEPTTEAQSEQTSQSQVQEAAQEPHLMANHQPTQQQSSSAIEPQQSTNLVESGVPFSQTFGAVDRASLMEMTPSQMAVTFPLNPSGE